MDEPARTNVGGVQRRVALAFLEWLSGDTVRTEVEMYVGTGLDQRALVYNLLDDADRAALVDLWLVSQR